MLRSAFLRAEAVRLVHHEVHLRRLDAAHLPDRALELSFERAAIVDALCEIRHPPRRLVEQLEPRAARVRQAALCERDARLREIGRATMMSAPPRSSWYFMPA